MFAALTGTRSRPVVELYFDYESSHHATGALLRDWVKAMPARIWNERSKSWKVIEFGGGLTCGVEVEAELAKAGFTTVVGGDDEPVSLRGLTFIAADRPSTPTADPAHVGIFDLQNDGTLDGLRRIPVDELDSVNRATAVAMGAFGIANVYDLLHVIPRRYIDLSNPQSVTDSEPGGKIAVLGVITSVKPGADARAMSRINVRDTGGTVISCRFFNASWMMRKFASGQDVILHGKVETWDRPGGVGLGYGMTNPLIDVLASDAASGRADGGASGQGMLPVYPQSAKADVDTWKLHRAAKEAVARLGALADPIADLAELHGLVARRDAYVGVHQGDNPRETIDGRNRLAYDELLRMQLGLMRARNADDANGAVEHHITGYLTDQLITSLPFPLTGAQQRAVEEITLDLVATRPMHRLLQGEVGSGKTLTVLLGLLACVEGGHQGVLMAPTEILASQHFAELIERMDGILKADGSPVVVELLTNKVTGKKRKDVIAGLADGSIDIAVGTHALLADSVVFVGLGLAVIDEQHRFGVEQRAVLRAKGADGRFPDMLVATATPIPRTAVLTIFGDLDVSVLDELPPGRTPTITRSVSGLDAKPTDPSAPTWKLVRREIEAGHQAFVVCPMVNDSETKAAAAAETTADLLRVGALAGASIGVVHGKQKTDERAQVMAQFAAGTLDVLVATTVIEVGVNVPNATVMVITSAERFGLAQLHQLRGRVGRGKFGGHCILAGDPKATDGAQRLAAMVETTDGFKLSEVDLRIRGWGTLLGGNQSGSARDLRVADLFRDTQLLAWARADAQQIALDDPEMATRPELLHEVGNAIGDDETAWLTSA